MRIRTVKPDFWLHKIMANLPAETQLIALGLLNMSDDEGYFYADAAIVRGSIAPYRENLATISRDMSKLCEIGWIEVSKHPDHGEIGHVINWERHQKVDHPKASKIKVYFIRENVATNSRDVATNSSWNREQGTGNREQDTTRKKSAGRTRKEKAPQEPKFDSIKIFCEVWKGYKHKTYKPGRRDVSVARSFNSDFMIGRDEIPVRAAMDRFMQCESNFYKEKAFPYWLFVDDYNKFSISIGALERRKNLEDIENISLEMADVDSELLEYEPVETEAENV